MAQYRQINHERGYGDAVWVVKEETKSDEYVLENNNGDKVIIYKAHTRLPTISAIQRDWGWPPK
jgi:hypothetical protein